MIDKDKLNKHQNWVNRIYSNADGQAIDLWGEGLSNDIEVLISNDRYSNRERRRIEEEAWSKIIKDGHRVLDCGCGTGYFIERIRQTFSDLKIEFTGLDLSDIALEKARQRLPDVEFVCGPAEKLRFEDEYFDVVLLIAMLWESIDSESVIEEAHRVLKSNGHLYIVIHKPFWDPIVLPSIATRLYRAVRGLPTEHGSLRRFRKKMLKKLMDQGFSLVEKRPIIYSFQWSFWMQVLPFMVRPLFKLGRLINRLPFTYYKNQEYWILRKSGPTESIESR